MAAPTTLTRLIDGGIVPVVRAARGDNLAQVAEALLAGGVACMEITFTVPGAVHVLEQLADRFGDRLLLGAGSVLDAETARAAILAGAEFVVSPHTSLPTIELCRRYSKPVLPGAYTPTEVVTAWQAGADIVKIFPASVGGPSYFKALRGPLPQVKLMPTGGVNLETAADFLRAGACALGVGGALVDPQAIEQEDFARITRLAEKFTRIVGDVRSGN